MIINSRTCHWQLLGDNPKRPGGCLPVMKNKSAKLHLGIQDILYLSARYSVLILSFCLLSCGRTEDIGPLQVKNLLLSNARPSDDLVDSVTGGSLDVIKLLWETRGELCACDNP